MIATEDFRCGAVVQQGHGDSAVCGRPNYGTDNWQCRDCAISERDQLKAENERLKMELECAQLNLSIAVGVKNSQQDELREAQAENERLREDDVRFIALMAQGEKS